MPRSAVLPTYQMTSSIAACASVGAELYELQATARDVHADPVPQTDSVATQTTRAAPAATGTKCDGLAPVGQQANSTITLEVSRRLATSLTVMTPALVAAGDGAMLVHVNGMMEGLRARLSELEDAAAVHASRRREARSAEHRSARRTWSWYRMGQHPGTPLPSWISGVCYWQRLRGQPCTVPLPLDERLHLLGSAQVSGLVAVSNLHAL
jgi:hypothetical protein